MKAVRPAIFGFVLLFLSASTVMARELPPGRFARLQYVNGSVSVQPQGTQEWVAAVVNRPLATSDNVWTDKNSRAELGVGTGVLRMNGETSLTLTNISMGNVQVTLHQGTLNLRVFHLFGGEIYEVDTPNLVFTVQKSGDYRFDVDSGGDATVVTVWKGEGNATGDGPAVRVRSHEQARFTGTLLTRNVHGAPRPDGFDSWCQVRNQRQEHSLYGPYVAPGVVGYPPYPYPPAYPYGYGPWVWVAPWGWVRR
jgi:hypothetical protein